jgi:threonine synthase
MNDQRPPLRSVKPGEAAPAALPDTPETISDAVESGTSRDVLAAMRKALAKKLDDGDVSSNAIASAYKELRELDRLIRQLDHAAEDESREDSDVDEGFDASAI